PPPDFLPIEAGFDPLQDLIQTAHANGIEVHAFVIMGAVWNKNPTFAPTATLGPPTSPRHVFNQHGGFDAATGRIEPGANNWLTRSLLADGTAGITFQGHRFGSEFWLDFGHPEAAEYSASVVLDLVRRYDIDGLHLDRIRYPDFSATGQTPTTGTNIGYNAVSVWRFQEYYGIPHEAAAPEPGDPRWAQWRRDQVTGVVRRIYLNAVAMRPNLVVSAALIAYGGGPTTEAAWGSAEAYWRVYQDWRAWLEEGILDIAIPMNYKRESVAQQAGWYDQWTEWTRTHQYGRGAMMGLGIYLNSIEGTLRQTRRAVEAEGLIGVNFYAMANPDAAVAANPHSVPAGADTPVRGFGEFASGLVTGKSVDGSAAYEDLAAQPVAVFAEEAKPPRLAWKVSPKAGHLMGYARRADGMPLDSADVYVFDARGQQVRTTRADGNGFFGVADLEPGEYAVIADLRGEHQVSLTVTVTAGRVSEIQFGL
ncbi:MAG: family 10 glycosylhydrolase, partial [Acidobacteria bacterium]|nr:family 10 glycosylhydrolase [Acidobacteriota bacterium]